VLAIYPVYVQERARLVSNAACMLRCARQYGPHASDGGRGYRLARKAEQRDLAALRRNWAPVRAAITKATGAS